MANLSEFLLLQLIILLIQPQWQFVQSQGIAKPINKNDFPTRFLFGAGSSAYQIEGAAAEDGRKPSIWDSFTHAGKIVDKSTGDIAADQYHKYKEDVKMMHDMGLDAYRFSISWSRLIPDGRGAINPKGLQYYNNLIDELVNHGIEAHVTLVHFDIPQALEDEYGGLLSPKIIADFTAYANICFREFGNRVSSWSTFNEPNILTVLAYDVGIFPPSRCSYPFGLNCSNGNSSVEVYITAHNILLSHAAAANLYREKYQAKQEGSIGITLLAFWFEPHTNSSQDVAAMQRVTDFQLGWFLDPLTHGDYPATMRKIVGSRLPSLSEEESKQLKGSFDYIGLNHYTVVYVKDYPGNFEKNERDYVRDISAKITLSSNSVRLDEDINLLKYPVMPPLPWGLQRLLEHIKLYYNNSAVIIHENGLGMFHSSISRPLELEDDAARVDFLLGYIESLLLSIRNGSNVRGYFVWSFLDCFETLFGYTFSYGLIQVDFDDDDRKRYPRLSAHWYSNFLQNKNGRKGGIFSRINSQQAFSS